MSSSNSPCAACKLLRRKCPQECVFAPYFPPDQPQKFANVHKVFGASNVSKLLNELDARHREDAVNSLAYEAEFRLRDPVYGCVGLISVLQHRLKQMQTDLINAKKELASYIGPQAIFPVMQPSTALMAQQHPGNPSSSSLMPYNMPPMMGIPTGPSGQLMVREPHQQQQPQQQQQQQQQHQLHQQQLFEAQQLAAAVAAREHQEMFRAYEQKQQQTHHRHHPQQQQQELLRLNPGFDVAASVSASGFNQLNNASALSPSLALGTFDNAYHLQPELSEHPHTHHHHQLQAQLLLQPQQPQPPNLGQQSQLLQQNKTEGEDDRIVGPSH